MPPHRQQPWTPLCLLFVCPSVHPVLRNAISWERLWGISTNLDWKINLFWWNLVSKVQGYCDLMAPSSSKCNMSETHQGNFFKFVKYVHYDSSPRWTDEILVVKAQRSLCLHGVPFSWTTYLKMQSRELLQICYKCNMILGWTASNLVA